jgi:hypothetical protein
MDEENGGDPCQMPEVSQKVLWEKKVGEKTMITMQTFTESTVIDITNLTEIIARKAFKTDEPVVCYREMQFIDDKHRMVTLRLFADDLEKLRIVENE